jgi:O-antigen/teichoic acid export membrane protein
MVVMQSTEKTVVKRSNVRLDEFMGSLLSGDRAATGVPKRIVQALRSGLVTNTVWNVLGAVFNQGSTFALGVIVAKDLGRESYGSYAFLQGTLATLIIVSQVALGFVATKCVAEYRSTQKERAGRIIAVSIIISAITGLIATAIAVGGANLFATRVAHQPQVMPLIRFASPTVFFAVVTAILTGSLAGLAKFRIIAVTGVIAGTAYLALGAAGAIGWQLRGVAVALALSAALQTVIVWVALFRETARAGIPIVFGGIEAIKAERTMLQHMTLPASLAGFVNMMGIWLSMAILARQADGITQLALFTAANSLRMIVAFVPVLINNVGFPMLSNLKGEADSAGYRRMFWTNVAAVAGAALCGAIVVAAAGPLVLRLFGKSFAAGYPVLLILLLTTLPEALGISIHQAVQTHGSLWITILCVSLPREVVCILAALILAPRYGAIGLAMAYLLGYSVAFVGVLINFARIRHHAMADVS